MISLLPFPAISGCPWMGVVMGRLRCAAAGAVAVVMLVGGTVGCSSGGDSTSGSPVPALTTGPTALAWAPEDVTPQKMSNPESEYTAESLPDDLDDTGKEIAGVYVASDRLTWEAFRAMDGDLSQVETVMTGEAFRYFDDLYSDYQANGWHMEGQYSTSVQDVSVSEGNAGQATMMACNDQRQIRVVSDGGEDAGKDTAHTYMRRITLIKDEESGTWMVSSDEKVGVDQC